MYKLNFFLLLFSLIFMTSCEDDLEDMDNADQENFLSETIIEDLYGNENYEIFLSALEKSENFSKELDEPSTIEILKRNNPVVGDEFTVFIPTDSSLNELSPNKFDTYNDEDWYNFVRSHIHAGTLSLDNIGSINMLEDSINLLGSNHDIDLSFDTFNFYAEGWGFNNGSNNKADAILTTEGLDFIINGESKVHSIEGDFVNIIPREEFDAPSATVTTTPSDAEVFQGQEISFIVDIVAPAGFKSVKIESIKSPEVEIYLGDNYKIEYTHDDLELTEEDTLATVSFEPFSIPQTGFFTVKLLVFDQEAQSTTLTFDIKVTEAIDDGYYFVQTDTEILTEKSLISEKVEGDGFSPVDREGFYGNFMFLQAGEYELIAVEGGQISNEFGGQLMAPSNDEGYLIANTVDGGQLINVATTGFYKLTFDETLNELILMTVTNAAIIGSATDNGWAEDTTLPVKEEASNSGFVFEGTDIVLRSGDYKIRINNRWNIDRRLDKTIPSGPGNGYVAFTNYGGSNVDNIQLGGNNLTMDPSAEGVFTVELRLTHETGASLQLERTGDAPVITFDPADYQWAFVGDATADNWGEFSDRNMQYVGEDNGIHKWVGMATFDSEGTYKFRANDSWDLNLGGILPADGSQINLDLNGNDMTSPGNGAYYVVLSTADEGDTWQASMNNSSWGIIGEGSPSNSWDTDIDMTANGFSNGISEYVLTGSFSTGSWKFRADDDWLINLGGTIDNVLDYNGTNITLSESGTYTITLSYDGNNYSATAVKQ